MPEALMTSSLLENPSDSMRYRKAEQSDNEQKYPANDRRGQQ